MKKRIALASLTALVGIGAVAGLAGSASAAETTGTTGFIKQYAISYTSPSDVSVPVHKGLQPNTAVETMCTREGQELNGSSTWFLIQRHGDLGYVHRDVISVSPTETPDC